MSVSVDVRDDPDRPEGGHALVHFRSVSGPTGRRILDVEPLTEGYAYSGPREIEVDVSAENGGLLLRVGDGALDELAPGIAVRLSIEGSDVEAETLWPSLTPRARIPTRRAAMASGRKRQVVEVTSGRGRTGRHTPPIGDSFSVKTSGQGDGLPLEGSEPIEVLPPKQTDIVEAKTDETRTEVGGDTQLGLVGDRAKRADDDKAVEQSAAKDVRLEPPPKRRGWPTTVVAIAAAIAFGIGLAVPFVFKLTPDKPVPVPETPVRNAIALPSPYAFLANLSQVSPGGTYVEGRDWRAFLTRSRNSKSPEEKSFWRKWAMRAVLENRAAGAATSLVDFATDLAEAQPDEATLASSRLLWELAAVAGDCKAMSNIAKALTKPENSAEEKTWSDRARRCLNGTPRP